jgi:hypothetical protein
MQHFVRDERSKERNSLMRVQRTLILPLGPQRSYLELIISYLLLIKLFFSLTTRCEQYKGYQKALQSLDNNSLKSSYKNLEAALARDGKSDIDANKLYVKLVFLQDFIPEGNMGPVEILQFLKRHDCFSIMQLSHEVLLTIPVTIALAE